MLFTSVKFAVFFIVLFLLYWLVFNKKTKTQNVLLLAASYLFYGFWDFRFLSLLAGISLLNYFLGLAIGSSSRRMTRKTWLILGLACNIGTLVTFKYFDFFLPGLQSLFSVFSIRLNLHSLGFIVPLGISFYTFLSISYLVDIYRKKLEPEKNVFYVLLSLSFFPIVLAGPINRPVLLLPQIKSPRVFDPVLASDGLRQFLWGLAVKMIIADNCAVYADKTFADPSATGSTLFYGALFFSIQIYADFSSYSDMAIGISKLLGFRLIRNFNFPYFATDIADFWRRWHISLTTWFRDYLFLPLAYFLSGKIKTQKVLLIRSDLIIYILSILFTWSITGFWHGAAWTFIIWGLIHAFFLIIHQVFRKIKKRALTRYHLQKDLLVVAVERFFTLGMIVLAWVFFRSKTLPKAIDYLDRTFTVSLFSPPLGFPTKMIIPIFIFFTIEWFQRDKQHGLDFSDAPKTRFIRWAIYLFIVLIIFFYQVKQQEFIYP